MRVAIAHDYLVQAGGAERVIEAMHGLWHDAPIFTSVYDPASTLKSFQQMDVRTSFLQRWKWARANKTHKLALPFFPMAFEQLDVRGYDVIVSNTTSFAKGIITEPECCHICYCHTPSRFAWRYHEYIAQGNYSKIQRRLLPFIVHFLRTWDLGAASRVDYFLSNSYNIARRVKKYYGRDSEVLYPPVEAKRFQIVPNPTADYFLVVSRLQVYKRVDLAVQACSKLGIPLKVAGGGPELERLKAMAGPTVEFLGRVPDGQVEGLFANCKAFLFPGEEDFGIAPLEAMASGRPVIAYRAGGATETVVEGKTGVFFEEQSVDALAEAIERLNRLSIDPPAIRWHAERYDVSAFQARLAYFAKKYLALHRAKLGQYQFGVSPDATVVPTDGIVSGNGVAPAGNPVANPLHIGSLEERR
jgi:glycosyltransferase involved in cell wall biosynthesis